MLVVCSCGTNDIKQLYHLISNNLTACESHQTVQVFEVPDINVLKLAANTWTSWWFHSRFGDVLVLWVSFSKCSLLWGNSTVSDVQVRHFAMA